MKKWLVNDDIEIIEEVKDNKKVNKKEQSVFINITKRFLLFLIPVLFLEFIFAMFTFDTFY